MKKMPRDIILHMCTKNYDQMMYGSRDFFHNGWTDGQLDRWMDRQTNRLMVGQTGRWMVGQTDRWTVGWTENVTYRGGCST